VGRDSYSCGAGNDTVFADALETAGADCEDVRRPAPPPEPTPPPLLLPTGRYVLVTSQGNAGTFTVVVGGSFVGFVLPYRTTCQPSGALTAVFSPNVVAPIALDLSFSIDRSGQSAGGGGASGTFTATVEGRFQTTGDVSGTARIQDKVDSSGTHYECDTGVITFTGKPSP
jgi:hypothetical protein